MAQRYNLQLCSDTTTTAIGYSENGSVTIGRAYKINNICWLVTSQIEDGATTGISLDTASNNYTNCSECIASLAPPPPVPPTVYLYRIRPCGNPNSAAEVDAYRETTNLYPGYSVKIGTVCWEVLYANGSTTLNNVPAGAVDIRNLQSYIDCNQCINPLPPGGGGGGSTPANVYIYKVRQCGVQSSAAIVDAYRSTTDLFPGYAVKLNNVCLEVQDTPGYPISVPLNQIPPGATDIRNANSYSECAACTSTLIGGGTGPGGGGGGNGGFQGEQGLGPDGGVNPSLNVTVYYCNNGQCTSFTYDPNNQAGIEPPTPNYPTFDLCAASGCGIQPPPPATRYNCTINGCQQAVNGQYTSQLQCQTACGTPQPTADWFRCTLRNCENTNETIIGHKTTFQNPGVIYRFYETSTTWKCYTLETVTSVSSPSEQYEGPNLDDKFAYQECEQCLPDEFDDPDEPLPLCVQFPDHPDCNPCTNNPCAPGCPLDCSPTGCPEDPRCITTEDPCANVPEPVQGQYLDSWWSGGPFYQQRQASDYNWMIHECWQHKYCACKVQPNPNDPYSHDFVVCLCGEPIDIDTPNPCPAAGTLVKYECRNSTDPNNSIKLEKWGVYTNGSCGTYDQLIESNSVYCGATPNPTCPPPGTLVRTYCINTDKYGEYHDGNCGKYIERIEVNSKTCGYVDPPPPPPPPPPKVETEPPASARVYYPVRKEDTLRTVDVTSFALWSNDTPFLLNPSTQSLSDSSSLNYILHVYDKSPDSLPTCSAELQYNIIYADYEGKGATDLGGYDNQTLTKAMYTQYAHVLLPYGQEKFNFNGEDEDYVYIIDIARKRFKQSLDPGNWEITFASSSFSLETGSNSILSNMYTASYKNTTLSLVDSLAKRPDNLNPIYLSSKSYDVYVGTLEDGIGTNFVTASIASSSLATTGDTSYISTATTPTAQTVIVKGSRVYYFGLDGTVHYQVVDGTGSRVIIEPPKNIKNVQPYVTMTAAYSMSRQEIISEYGYYLVKYEGAFTGSFALPLGATLSPTVISGSCVAQIYYDISGQPQAVPAELQYIEGFTFNTKQTALATQQKQRLTVNALSYNGVFKWHTVPQPIGNLFSGSIDFNVPNIQGSYTGSTNLAFVTDDWGIQEFIEDPTYPFTDFSNFEDLDNGFILTPVKRTVYGKVYPSHGIIVLSGKKLDELLGLNTNRSIDKNGYNTYRLHHSMKLVLDTGLTDLSGDKLAFYARGVDIKRSARYFITLKNSHLNYSNNPTYVSGSEGDIADSFIRQNKAYFSSVGLYNDDKELLAIGKVSRPIMSSLTDEMLFTVKITQ